ncbi:TetR/AcrR family transcriptional regulator [Aeromicrobium chenweiae]|uniref:TetR/AcrR family transcriptional regulator n=1 Tax=Aeromicrobium chenweiae TaxID=2079793 RepID=A0A2S0WM84_9ACTN|nr:TetR/AcrR family transcriptional regulator [Aeromicrobium chenweiae]AWB92380.1 TetR/AcrR family transcriptional regulator [Aeromicrobium chenweiae]TGN31333.1 TetR/AcrR family transcriptional regulator [Aeromicrobium chenweiae]
MTTITEPRMTPTAVRILRTAADLFYANGLRAVGVERIAEDAGTTKKTIYDRFGSKDGLITAYLRDRRDRWHAFVTAYVDERAPEPGRERVLAVLDALEAWMAQGSRGCGFVNAYAELGGTDHPALPIITEEKQWTRDYYVELLTEMDVPEPDRRGREVALVHEGATVQLTAGGQPDAMTDARALVGRILDAGVAARDATGVTVG